MRTQSLSRPAMAPVVLGLIMVLTAGLSVMLAPKPSSEAGAVVRLEELVPRAFGPWRMLESGDPLTGVAPHTDEQREQGVYDQTLLRTYAASSGERMMLALAYGRRQRQETKVHRPELCYVSQGFEILRKQAAGFDFGAGSIPVTRLVAHSAARYEPVTYWIRLGDGFSSGAVETRVSLLKQGLLGNIPDGILVRVSSISPDGHGLQQDFAAQQKFLRDLLAGLDPSGRELLLGKRASAALVAGG
jgi:EpsI family protein